MTMTVKKKLTSFILIAAITLIIGCEDNKPDPCPFTTLNNNTISVNGNSRSIQCISSAHSHGTNGETLHQYIDLSDRLRIYLEYPTLNPDADSGYPFTFEAGTFTAELEQMCEGNCEGEQDGWITQCSYGSSGSIRIDSFTLDSSLKNEAGEIENPFGYFDSFKGAFDITFESCTIPELDLNEESVRIEGNLDWALK